MAIRVEFYAEDQVTASSIVEFALSKGAVLQSYAEVEAPMKRPRQAGKHGGKRTRRINGTTFVKCVNSDNLFREGGARYLAAEVVARHNVPILYASLVEEIDRKVEIHDSNIRKVLQIMLKKGHLVITHK